MRRRPRNVIRSGAPGPAPMKCTVMPPKIGRRRAAVKRSARCGGGAQLDESRAVARAVRGGEQLVDVAALEEVEPDGVAEIDGFLVIAVAEDGACRAESLDARGQLGRAFAVAVGHP